MTVEEAIRQAVCTNGDIHLFKEMDYHVENIGGINVIITASDLADGNYLDIHVQLISDRLGLSSETHNVIRQETGKVNFIHRHNFYESMYVMSGSVLQIINGQEILVEKNQMFLMNTGVEHMDRLSENTMVLYIQITEDIMDDIVAHCEFSEPMKKFFRDQKQDKRKDYLHCTIQDTARFEIIVNRLINEQKAHLAGYKYIVRGLVCRILMIMNGQSKDSVRYVSDEPSDSLLLFKRIEQYLEEHCWNVDNKELSGIFYYSENYMNTSLQLF
ncbi:hypothetical protein E5329_20070 [Petralouisia muris]|jgi:mannose-6-phosphate isomerase-like protein (cupin superfamily)|uniref:Uncharacterized protein n=1 Tax=Petralouisia muris TaxID=3032872 RepID=A0AC61RSL1_9FIRM|nr:AraC family ligand binding domain-containing protein [Petralouisia muris]TGY91794.1 hypothetical protein E5329_20070 [Petralouisia muris]